MSATAFILDLLFIALACFIGNLVLFISPPLLSLPPELMIEILSYVDDASKITFSLACKGLHRTYFQPLLRGNRQSKRALLLMLERDVPSLYFCHECLILHSWHDEWIETTVEGAVKKQMKPRPPCEYNNIMAIQGEVPLPYPVGRVIMNRHFFGDAHGPPVQALEMTQSFEHRYGVYFLKTYHSRIINNQLITSTKVDMYHPQGDYNLLRSAFFDYEYFGICNHIKFDKRLPPISETPKLEKGPRINDFPHWSSIVRSCRACMADYHANVIWEGGERGWHIQVTTYHLFGDLRSPRDWLWQSKAYINPTMWRIDPVRRRTERDQSVHQPGIVRSLWSLGDDKSLPAEGEWAKCIHDK